MNFDDWYKELCSDERWFEQASMHYKPETFQETARQVWVNGLAEGESFKLIPMKAHRQHLFNKLSKLPPDRPKKKWWVKESDKEDVKPAWKETTPERRERWLKVLEWRSKKIGQPKKQWKPSPKDIFEEGQWDKKKVESVTPNWTEQIIAARQHLATARKARTQFFLSAYPDAQQDEIEAYLDKFKEIDNPLNL